MFFEKKIFCFRIGQIEKIFCEKNLAKALSYARFFQLSYTIPSNNRELQQIGLTQGRKHCYTIPSNNRELQLPMLMNGNQIVIPYQVITGNY